MKKVLFCISLLLYLCANPAWSYTIKSGTIDVGFADKLIGSGILDNSGDNTELNWVKKEIGIHEVGFSGDKFSDMTWCPTDQADIYAIDLSEYNARYFFIKIGKGKSGDVDDHYLFDNNSETDWGVVSLADLGIKPVIDTDRISHCAAVKMTPVPVPATLLLFGTGLLGLAGLRKKIGKQ